MKYEKENKEILIGKTPEEYADHIIFLLENPEKAMEIAQNGYDFVQKNYSWDKHNAILQQIISTT